MTVQPSRMDETEFVETFGGVFEHSPWIAAVAWRSGLEARHDDPDALAEAMRAIVDISGAERQLALIRAHPDLAGRLAVAGELTAQSTSEQAGAGLDKCTAEEFTRFQDLNTSYLQKFDFPFIMAVRGHDRAAILSAFAHRLDHSVEQEFTTALTEIGKIASLRIHDIFDGA